MSFIPERIKHLISGQRSPFMEQVHRGYAKLPQLSMLRLQCLDISATSKADITSILWNYRVLQDIHCVVLKPSLEVTQTRRLVIEQFPKLLARYSSFILTAGSDSRSGPL